jgi:flavin-binding protein dodecin
VVKKERKMADSVYKVITLIGTSTESWEQAAAAAVRRAAETLEDLRVAEVRELDMLLEEGNVISYRAKVRVSFKYRESERGEE